MSLHYCLTPDCKLCGGNLSFAPYSQAINSAEAATPLAWYYIADCNSYDDPFDISDMD